MFTLKSALGKKCQIFLYGAPLSFFPAAPHFRGPQTESITNPVRRFMVRQKTKTKKMEGKEVTFSNPSILLRTPYIIAHLITLNNLLGRRRHSGKFQAFRKIPRDGNANVIFCFHSVSNATNI